MPSININSSTGRIQYTATSGQTVFTYDFIIFSEADLVVVQDGTTLTYLTDYTITGVGNATGGTVTLLVGATTGDLITIYRDTAISRVSQYNPDGRFDAAPLERDFDKITTILQEIKRDSNRTVKLSPDDPASSLTLPLARENKFLSFDASGTPIAVTGSTSSGAPFGTIGTALAATDTKAAAISVLGLLTDDQTAAGAYTFDGTVGFRGKSQYINDGNRTISSGALTITGTYHTVSSQVAASADDLDTISTTGNGLYLILRANSASEPITIKHGTGNILTPNGADITLDSTSKIITLLYDTTLSKWQVVSGQLSAGGLIPIKTTIVSSPVSSVSFANGTGGVILNSTYRNYKIIITNLIPSTDATAQLYMRTSTDAGSSYDSGASDYYYSILGSSTSSAIASQIKLTNAGSGGLGNVAGENVNAEITIYNPAGSSIKMIEARVVYHDPAGNPLLSILVGQRTSTADIDAVSLFMSSGDISSGTFSLYGIL